LKSSSNEFIFGESECKELGDGTVEKVGGEGGWVFIIEDISFCNLSNLEDICKS
jgi:hypothetical protein